jgi:uncharacterized protein (TIGR02246 family)
MLAGRYSFAPRIPCVPRYEIAGVVEAVGPSVRELSVGDRVAALTVCLGAQVDSVQASSEDTKAIEAIVHSNPSDRVTEDVSFTNIFGTVRYGRAEFVKRHIEIANTIFRGTTPKSSIAKLRFVRQDVAIADVSGEITGFPKTPPQGCPLERTECCVSSCFLVLLKEQGVWWITEYHNVAVAPEV